QHYNYPPFYTARPRAMPHSRATIFQGTPVNPQVQLGNNISMQTPKTYITTV
ncbi:unnamed protein product, partial [Fusarium fujikuroi]